MRQRKTALKIGAHLFLLLFIYTYSTSTSPNYGCNDTRENQQQHPNNSVYHNRVSGEYNRYRPHYRNEPPRYNQYPPQYYQPYYQYEAPQYVNNQTGYMYEPNQYRYEQPRYNNVPRYRQEEPTHRYYQPEQPPYKNNYYTHPQPLPTPQERLGESPRSQYKQPQYQKPEAMYKQEKPTNTNTYKKEIPQPTKPNLEYRALDKEYVALAKKNKKEGNNSKTIEYYKKAIAFNPNNKEANFDLAGIFYAEGKHDEAIYHYKRTAKIDPDCSQAYFNGALCHIQKKEDENAIENLKKAIELNPNYLRAYKQLGILLDKNKKTDEAIRYFEKAYSCNPNSFDIAVLLGKNLKKADRFSEALTYFEKALTIRPDNCNVMLEIANTLNMQANDEKDLEKSLDLYKRVLKIDPNLPTVKYNIAYTLKKLDRVPEAMPYYNDVLKSKPEYSQARFSRALAFLVMGNFTQGWPEYEWRWKAYNETPKKFSQPLWDGSDLTGKRILLVSEQGLGDTFQFIRYAKIAKKLGAYVIVEVQRPLKDIISQCEYIDEVVPRREPLPEFDCYIHLMSIPRILKTEVDTVPRDIPYLKADPNLVSYWQKKLEDDKDFRVGICWQGNRSYRSQALKHAVNAKSMRLHQLQPLSEIPGISLYSLQKMNGEEQIKNAGFTIHEFGPDFDETHGRFMDTAALIKNLDLVITVDTSVCHIASGLGVPVWNMLPKPADWRWLLRTLKTPWYPNMKLFRQKKIGDWDSVIQDICKELHTLLAQKNSGSTKNVTAHKETDGIVFHDMKDMDLAEVIDKIVALKVQYDNSGNNSLPEEIEKLENHLNKISSIYTNTDAPELQELTDKLYEVNKQLFLVDNNIADIQDRSTFNKEFVNLTKKAKNIKNLKKYIKNKINEVVRPKK